MKIRNAIKEDVPQIIELCKAHAAYEQSNYKIEGKSENLIKYLFKESNGLQCLVVEQDEVLVGYTTFIKQFSTWDADYYLYLDCLFLKEETRGIGIGKQLMLKVKEYAVSENCIAVQWQTPEFNKRAIKFYKNLGAKSLSKERFTWGL